MVPAGSVTRSPAGISTAGQSRDERYGFVLGVVHHVYSVVTASPPSSRHGRLQRVPGQARALHARRVLAHAAERRELVEVLGRLMVVRTGQEVVHLIEQSQRVGTVGAFHALGHQRRRRDGDRTAAAFEADVLDVPVADLHVQRELVAAQWVDGRDHARGVAELAEIARVAVVIEDHLPVQLLRRHPRKISTARRQTRHQPVDVDAIVVEARTTRARSPGCR